MCEDMGDGNARAFPPALETKLVEVKAWYDEHAELERLCRLGGSAQRNQDDLDASDRVGACLLREIIEMVDEAWGF